jgi:hypothetical protein
MPFTVPDQGEGDNDIQSILFQEDLDILVAGLAGIDCVLSGLAVTGGADMTPAVAKGAVLSNRTMFAVAAADVTVGAADATNPRIDLIVVNSAGALEVRAGTAASAPRPPVRTANDVVIAFVYVPANDTAIATTQIIDKRVFPGRPTTLFRRTTNTATNTTTARVDILNVSIPNGLMAAGNQLEFLITGTVLLNSGTPTLTFSILYGGTMIFSDASAASTADADRLAFCVHGLISSEANADQKCGGVLNVSLVGAKTAPTTGRAGDWVATNLNYPFACALGVVDSDTANRDFVIGFTMNVSNAANEVDVEQAVLRLN